MDKQKESVINDLQSANAQADIIAVARESLERNFPKKVYTHAIWFLGSATIVLVVGAIVSVLRDQQASDAMWTAVGAGLGSLAGIFTAKSST